MGSQTVNGLDVSPSGHTRQESLPDNCASHAAEVARAAQQELNTLLLQRAELMKRIGTVKQTLAGLTTLFGGAAASGTWIGSQNDKAAQASHQTGLTNACRMALLQASVPLRAHQVRDRLRFQGFLLETHRDPVATVTTILRRLGQYGEARSVVLPDGKRGWEWISQTSGESMAEGALPCGSHDALGTR